MGDVIQSINDCANVDLLLVKFFYFGTISITALLTGLMERCCSAIFFLSQMENNSLGWKCIDKKIEEIQYLCLNQHKIKRHDCKRTEIAIRLRGNRSLGT